MAEKETLENALYTILARIDANALAIEALTDALAMQQPSVAHSIPQELEALADADTSDIPEKAIALRRLAKIVRGER